MVGGTFHGWLSFPAMALSRKLALQHLSSPVLSLILLGIVEADLFSKYECSRPLSSIMDLSVPNWLWKWEALACNVQLSSSFISKVEMIKSHIAL